VLRGLAAAGIRPQSAWLERDHAAFRGRPPRCRLDAWLTTPKCRSKLPPVLGGAPVWTLEHQVRLPPSLVAALVARLTC
jgi:hypothetical protein